MVRIAASGDNPTVGNARARACRVVLKKMRPVALQPSAEPPWRTTENPLDRRLDL
jgi:hypothetical protein